MLKNKKPIIDINKERVAYLGPEGTFSHQAMLNIFPRGKKLFPCSTITKIFEEVLNKKVNLGLVPAENSTEGLVQETLDNLIKYPLLIIGSYHLPIHLCLLGRTTNFKNIKIIKSHSQPIAQSRNWLEKNLPGVKLETESSSTKAILSTTDPAIAFIASKEAAQKYKLKILAEDIEDKKINITQFYLLARKEMPEITKKLKASKTLLLLAAYDRPGVLRDILNHFADRQLNLSKLHSKVSDAKSWSYYFFLEVEKLPADKKLKKALKEIKQYCSIVRILGVT